MSNLNNTLISTPLFGLDDGLETLCAISQTLNFTAVALSAICNEDEQMVCATAKGLEHLLQHLAALTEHAASQCQQQAAEQQESVKALNAKITALAGQLTTNDNAQLA